MGGVEMCATRQPCFSPWQMLVGVRVLDINDNDPVLLNLPMNLTLSENAAVSSFVTRILARDADQGPNALLTFDITAGNTENAFYINSTVRPEGWDAAPGRRCPRGSIPHIPCGVLSLQSGVVYVNRPLDRERVAEYRLTVTVKDNPENMRNARRVIMDTAGTSGGWVGKGASVMVVPLSTVFLIAAPSPESIWGSQGGGYSPIPSKEQDQ